MDDLGISQWGGKQLCITFLGFLSFSFYIVSFFLSMVLVYFKYVIVVIATWVVFFPDSPAFNTNQGRCEQAAWYLVTGWGWLNHNIVQRAA